MFDKSLFLSAKPEVKKVTSSLGDFYVKEINGSDTKIIHTQKNVTDMGVWCVLLCIVDEDGKRIFSDDDFDKVISKPQSQIAELIKTVTDNNGSHADPKK